MDEKKTVLIVDDKTVNLQILHRIIQQEYDVLEASNGVQAFEVLDSGKEVDAILLDLVMPEMDGYEFLAKIKDTSFCNCPVIVLTGATDPSEERRALEAGAWDFAPKPYDKQVLLCRLRNAIARSEVAALKQMNYLAQFDPLTGLYNKNGFFQMTEKTLKESGDVPYQLIRIDLDHFSLVNSFFGIETGDDLLKYIADDIRTVSDEKAIVGHMEADVFTICAPSGSEEQLRKYLRHAEENLQKYPLNFDIEVTFGIYRIEDKTMPVFQMLDYAHIAAKSIKGNVLHHYAYFKPEMKSALLNEQKVSNIMYEALEHEEFCVYLQPKYDIDINQPAGAEALVRWNRPGEGLISPGNFIPIFEKNGFIAKLDYYMWEHVCRLLQKWIREGKKPSPISVNVSRISMFDPNIVQKITGLVEKYQVPTELFQLEITESVYMADANLMKNVIQRLRSKGFTILMDDFGSGYSSLNTLKDIDIDILKIDMKFLPNGKDNIKSEKILTSVTRMAGWLGVSVVVEGVETKEQLDFLESIGCGYVQGYYFAKPMPVEEYEARYEKEHALRSNEITQSSPQKTLEAIWSADSEIVSIMNGVQVPFAIYEYANNFLEIIRANECYRKEFGDLEKKRGSERELFSYSQLEKLYQALKKAAADKSEAECDCTMLDEDGEVRIYRLRIQYICDSQNGAVFCITYVDVSSEKELNSILSRILGSMKQSTGKRRKLLVVDDSAVSRGVLEALFMNDYEVLHATNGEEALQIAQEHAGEIEVILLDLIMPKMDGEAFLQQRKHLPEISAIPVIIISAEDSTELQIQMLKYGVNDYVTKPYIPEIVRQRVKNVIEYNSRFQILLKEYAKKM